MGRGIVSEPYNQALAMMTAHYNGHRYRLERVRLDDVHDWLEHHDLSIAGTAQGLTNSWPVLICERRSHAAPAASP